MLRKEWFRAGLEWSRLQEPLERVHRYRQRFLSHDRATPSDWQKPSAFGLNGHTSTALLIASRANSIRVRIAPFPFVPVPKAFRNSSLVSNRDLMAPRMPSAFCRTVSVG